MNSLIKSAAELVLKKIPMKNIIVLESIPDFSDNTRAVFNELVKRRINESYQLVWTTHEKMQLPDDLKNIKNVFCADMNSFKYKYYYSYFAKAIIVSNYFMQRRREEQYYLYLTHGSPFKKIKDNRYCVPNDCYGCDFCSYSYEMGKLYAEVLKADENTVNILPVGYARNDELFNKIDVKTLFNSFEFSKLIYWMPTFRQKTGAKASTSYSSITVPFIHNEKSAAMINNAARENNVLIVLKPHPAQDISYFKSQDFSNIVFIDNEFLDKNKITNYELLGSCDALLTDYSSVCHDFLLCDKPIGFCWEDYEEYNLNEGIDENVLPFLEGGVKIYSDKELCSFIQDTANGADTLKLQRNEIKKRVHKYTDNKSSERIVNRIIDSIGN